MENRKVQTVLSSLRVRCKLFKCLSSGQGLAMSFFVFVCTNQESGNNVKDDLIYGFYTTLISKNFSERKGGGGKLITIPVKPPQMFFVLKI